MNITNKKKPAQLYYYQKISRQKSSPESRDKEGHFTMLKGQIHSRQNVCAPINTVKNTKSKN